MRFSSAALAFVALMAVTPVYADNSADVTFWQSIQNSNDPAEYQAYLHAFPQGAFASLAQLRIDALKAGGAAHGPAANAPATGAVVGDGTLSISPANPRAGEQVLVQFANFPNLPVNDLIVIVAAGTPDNAPPGQAIVKTPVDPYQIEHGLTMGSLAPGNYEARWLTSLYDNTHKLEVGARIAFSVSR